MFDRYYCIKTNCDKRKFEIFEENKPVNLYFLRLKARGNGTFTACVLKTPFPGQIPTSCWRHVFTFATVHATDADVTFYDGPGMHTFKAAKQVYNSTWIVLLKHGFVLVKTWLLIACGTGFYAIMTIIGQLLSMAVIFYGYILGKMLDFSLIMITAGCNDGIPEIFEFCLKNMFLTKNCEILIFVWNCCPHDIFMFLNRKRTFLTKNIFFFIFWG